MLSLHTSAQSFDAVSSGDCSALDAVIGAVSAPMSPWGLDVFGKSRVSLPLDGGVLPGAGGVLVEAMESAESRWIPP